MELDELLNVLWDARDELEETGKHLDLVLRIEAQMNIVEEIIWKGKNEDYNL